MEGPDGCLPPHPRRSHSTPDHMGSSGRDGRLALHSLWKELPAAADSGPRTFEAFMCRIVLRDFMRSISICSTPNPCSKTSATLKALRTELRRPRHLKPGNRTSCGNTCNWGPCTRPSQRYLRSESKAAGLLRAKQHIPILVITTVFIGG